MLLFSGLKNLKDIVISDQVGLLAMENNDEIISRLKFIGHIQKDEKINVRHVHRQPNTLYTKISRTILYPDSRTNSLKFIRDVVSRSFEILEHFIHEKNTEMCKSIVSDLLRAKQGILNLKYTYAEDTKFCCDMDITAELLAVKINSLKEDHPYIFITESKSY